jgi:hypothetical protein
LAKHGVTSLEKLGNKAGMAELDSVLKEQWDSVFG